MSDNTDTPVGDEDMNDYMGQVDAEAAKGTPEGESVWATLSRPLPKPLVKQRTAPGGFKASYVPWAVTLKLFKAKYPQASVQIMREGEMNGGAYAVIRVTVDGVIGEGVGWEPFNPPTNINRETGEILRDKDGKLREDQRTDCGLMASASIGLRRAAGLLGLGIDLWVTESIQEAVNRVIDRVQPAGQEPARPAPREEPDRTPDETPNAEPTSGGPLPDPTPQNGSFGSQRAGDDDSAEEPPSEEVAPDPDAGAPSQPTASAEGWAAKALKAHPHLARMNHEQLVATCKAVEVRCHQHGLAGLTDTAGVERARTEHLGSTQFSTASDAQICGYYAWLRSEDNGPE